MILPITMFGLILASLSGCAAPEAMTRSGLVSAGLPRPLAACMAERMVDRLSLLQLRRLSALGKAGESENLEQFLHRVRALKDPETIGVVTSSAALCRTGLATL